MRTQRAELHRGPCHCGHGEFVIACCEPDLPGFKRSEGRYEPSIECGECSRRFSIIERREQFVLTENVNIDARYDLRNYVLTLRETFINRPDVQDMLARFAAKLDSFRYKRHIYRFLVKHGFSVGVGRATFVKNWSNGASWVELHIISREDIHKAAAALAYDAVARFDADLREIERFEAQMRVPIATVGEPIYKF